MTILPWKFSQLSSMSLMNWKVICYIHSWKLFKNQDSSLKVTKCIWFITVKYFWHNSYFETKLKFKFLVKIDSNHVLQSLNTTYFFIYNFNDFVWTKRLKQNIFKKCVDWKMGKCSSIKEFHIWKCRLTDADNEQHFMKFLYFFIYFIHFILSKQAWPWSFYNFCWVMMMISSFVLTIRRKIIKF